MTREEFWAREFERAINISSSSKNDIDIAAKYADNALVAFEKRFFNL